MLWIKPVNTMSIMVILRIDLLDKNSIHLNSVVISQLHRANAQEQCGLDVSMLLIQAKGLRHGEISGCGQQ